MSSKKTVEFYFRIKRCNQN